MGLLLLRDNLLTPEEKALLDQSYAAQQGVTPDPASTALGIVNSVYTQYSQQNAYEQNLEKRNAQLNEKLGPLVSALWEGVGNTKMRDALRSAFFEKYPQLAGKANYYLLALQDAQKANRLDELIKWPAPGEGYIWYYGALYEPITPEMLTKAYYDISDTNQPDAVKYDLIDKVKRNFAKQPYTGLKPRSIKPPIDQIPAQYYALLKQQYPDIILPMTKNSYAREGINLDVATSPMGILVGAGILGAIYLYSQNK